MEELKGEKKSVLCIDSNDFDKFVSDIFKCNYEFIPEHEAYNGCYYLFKATKEIPDYDKAEAVEVRVGKEMHNTHLIFDVLCQDGHIDEGEYLIKVYW
jgi:hypothetical protein